MFSTFPPFVAVCLAAMADGEKEGRGEGHRKKKKIAMRFRPNFSNGKRSETGREKKREEGKEKKKNESRQSKSLIYLLY